MSHGGEAQQQLVEWICGQDLSEFPQLQEFGDAAVALDNLDQSYSYLIEIDTNGDGTFDAQCFAEYDDPDPTLTDPGPNLAPADIEFIAPAVPDQREGVVDNPSGEFP